MNLVVYPNLDLDLDLDMAFPWTSLKDTLGKVKSILQRRRNSGVPLAMRAPLLRFLPV